MRTVALSRVARGFHFPKARVAAAALIACCALAWFAGRANAQYYWDPNGAGNVGGSGTWDPALLEWSTSPYGGSDVAWPNTAPSGAPAIFGGAGGTVSLYSGFNSLAVNSMTFENAYTFNGLGPAQAALNLSGSSPSIYVGSYNVTINARLSGTAGFTESGSGTLTLGGDNRALSGTITIEGNVSLSSASAASALANWELNGGTLSFNPTLGGTNRSIYLGALSGTAAGRLTNSGTAGAGDTTTFVVGAAGQSTIFSGAIADSAAGDPTALTLAGLPSPTAQKLMLAGTNIYSGPTTVTGGTLDLTGSIANSSAINLVFAGASTGQLLAPTLLLDNGSSTNLNQIGDTTPITLAGGQLEVTSTPVKSSETVGNVVLAGGFSEINLPPSAGSTAVLSVNSLTRSAGGGTLLVSGASLLVANPPATVGSGTSQYDTAIIPFAVGSGGVSYQFLTYSPQRGVVPLGSYAATLTAGDNVAVTSSATANSSVSINSLTVAGSATLTLNGGVTLDVASGALLMSSIETVAINGPSATLSFGGREAFLSAVTPGSSFAGTYAAAVNANLANLSRLTITAGMTLTLTQSSNTTDAAPVSLNSGTVIVTHDYDLGIYNGADAITFTQGNYAAKIQFTGTAFSTTKGIVLQGEGTFSGAATLGGPISGPGNLVSEGGPIALTNSANTLTGQTRVRSGTLTLSANSNNNLASSSTILAGDLKGTAATLDASGLTAAGGFVLSAGQTLAGFGTVKPPAAGLVVSSGSTISGGDATTTPGRLLTTGGQVWNGGGTYVWKIDLTNAGGGAGLNTDTSGNHWDQLAMSALNVTATSATPFNIQIQGIRGTGTNNFNPSQNYQWIVANMPSNAATGNLVGAFNLSVSGFEGYAVPGTFSAAFDNTSDPGLDDLVLTYTATPEPTSLALLGLAAGGLLIRRRRGRSF